MAENIIYSKKWNFDLDIPLEIYSNPKDIKNDKAFFKARYRLINSNTRLEKLEHITKKRIFNTLIELFNYNYIEERLIKRDCVDKSGKLKWYNEFKYNDSNKIEKSETYIKQLEKDSFELQNYSLFFYNNSGDKNLRKVLDPNSNLTFYEVFHYDDKKRLSKKEMFNKDNEKLFSEVYQYNDLDKIEQIDFFNSEGSFEKSLRVEIK